MSLTHVKSAHPSYVLRFPILLLIFVLGSLCGKVLAQHAPIIFYNVPNWTNDDHHVRYATPYDAFVIPWDSSVGDCMSCHPCYVFDGMYAEHVSGYEDGTWYSAYYYGKNEFTCVIDSGPYTYGSNAERWAYCAGIDQYGNSADQYSTAADGFKNSLCPAPVVDPEKSRGVPGCPCKLKGDPVNPGTGNKFEWLAIYHGSGVFPLDFSIAYNSRNSNSGIQTPMELVMGARRVHSYLRVIRLENNGVTATAYALRPDGKVLGFNQSGTSWIADADVSDTLAASYAADGSISGWTYTTDQGDQESYNSAGQLMALTTKGGLTQTLAYNAGGTLASVTDPEGRLLSFSYDSNGRVGSLQAPDGSVYGFAYDASNNLKTITYPDSSVLTLVYGENSAGANDLTGVIDESSNRTDTTQYNSADRATSTSGPNGIGQTSIAYIFTSAGTLIEQVTDPLGKVETTTTEYLLGTVRPLTVTQTCTGCTTVSKQYSYDSHGYLASSTDFKGNTTQTTYDANGLLDQQVDASGTGSQRTTNFTWNTTFRIPLTRLVLDANGHTVGNAQWVYNSTGQTLARCEIDPANSAASGYTCSHSGTVPAGVRRWTYTYCTAVDTTQCPIVGLMLTASGPRTDTAQTTTYGYYMASSATSCGTPGAACYQAGDLHTLTDAVGHVTTIASYDGAGRITRITDANGINTDLTYTPRGWLASRSVGGATTSFTYTPYGAVQTVTDADNATTTYGYDAAHRLNKITDAQGNYIQYTLDAAGNKTAEQVYDSSGTLHQSLSRTFNALGQLTKVMDGLSHTVFDASASNSYDANGNLVQSTDGLGIQRELGYDAFNRLVQTLDNYNGTN
ncbi:RHS repeat protein [Burkholderia pseudomallei]|nr:RHS repeat protein [Burkholderia pseudomallei]